MHAMLAERRFCCARPYQRRIDWTVRPLARDAAAENSGAVFDGHPFWIQGGGGRFPGICPKSGHVSTRLLHVLMGRVNVGNEAACTCKNQQTRIAELADSWAQWDSSSVCCFVLLIHQVILV